MDRPILFNDEMARAILDGRKTQTRRIVKHKYPQLWGGGYYPTGKVLTDLENQPGAFMEFRHETQDQAGYQGSPASALVSCPYGQPGDQLWVRETHYVWSAGNANGGETRIDYRATEPDSPCGGWTPSIHMPRWASRITLGITCVRVERLQDISEEGAQSEGVEPLRCGYWRHYQPGWTQHTLSAKGSFLTLWNSINGPESWDENPWVWVIEFRRVD